MKKGYTHYEQINGNTSVSLVDRNSWINEIELLLKLNYGMIKMIYLVLNEHTLPRTDAHTQRRTDVHTYTHEHVQTHAYTHTRTHAHKQIRTNAFLHFIHQDRYLS